MLVLAVDVDKHLTQCFYIGQRGRTAVDPRTRTTIGTDRAAQPALITGIQFPFTQPFTGYLVALEIKAGASCP